MNTLHGRSGIRADRGSQPSRSVPRGCSVGRCAERAARAVVTTSTPTADGDGRAASVATRTTIRRCQTVIFAPLYSKESRDERVSRTAAETDVPRSRNPMDIERRHDLLLRTVTVLRPRLSAPPRGRRKDGAMKCNEPYLTPELVRANTSQAVTVLWCGLPDGHDGVHGDPVPAPHMPSQMKSNS